MTSRLLALPAMLLALGCTGGVKESDTTTVAADSSNAIALADTTARAGSAAAGSPGQPGVGGLGRAGSGTRRPAAPPSGRAADARGVPVSDSTTRTGTSRDTATSRDAAASRDSAVTRGSAVDSARGIVAVVGTSLDSRVVLRPAQGRSVYLIGPMARDVGRLSGADVWASGNRDEHGQLRVSRFSVRSVDGNAALDGTLIARGERLFLVTRDGGQHALENAPASLKDHVGARVWVTGATGRGPIVYGVIEERR